MTLIIKKTHKRVLFIMGFLITGFASFLGSYLKENFSRDDSIFFSVVKADTPIEVSGTCFPAGAKISTPDGDKEIQNINIGDLVYGFDVESGEIGEYKVLDTTKHAKDDPDFIYSPLIKITYSGGSLIVTDNHWVYRKNGREGDYANFDRAGVLKTGDVLTLKDGSEVLVSNIEKGPNYDFVYNLEVDSVHTYFADNVRVHNGGGGAACTGGSAGGCSGK